MTNSFALVTSLFLVWPPAPETNVVGYAVQVNSLRYFAPQALFEMTNLPPGSYRFCVSSVDDLGLESEPTCLSTNLPRPNVVLLAEELQGSSNLTDWVTFRTNLWTNTLGGQGFIRSRLTITFP